MSELPDFSEDLQGVPGHLAAIDTLLERNQSERKQALDRIKQTGVDVCESIDAGFRLCPLPQEKSDSSQVPERVRSNVVKTLCSYEAADRYARLAEHIRLGLQAARDAKTIRESVRSLCILCGCHAVMTAGILRRPVGSRILHLHRHLLANVGALYPSVLRSVTAAMHEQLTESKNGFRWGDVFLAEESVDPDAGRSDDVDSALAEVYSCCVVFQYAYTELCANVSKLVAREHLHADDPVVQLYVRPDRMFVPHSRRATGGGVGSADGDVPLSSVWAVDALLRPVLHRVLFHTLQHRWTLVRDKPSEEKKTEDTEARDSNADTKVNSPESGVESSSDDESSSAPQDASTHRERPVAINFLCLVHRPFLNAVRDVSHESDGLESSGVLDINDLSARSVYFMLTLHKRVLTTYLPRWTQLGRQASALSTSLWKDIRTHMATEDAELLAQIRLLMPDLSAQAAPLRLVRGYVSMLHWISTFDMSVLSVDRLPRPVRERFRAPTRRTAFSWAVHAPHMSAVRAYIDMLLDVDWALSKTFRLPNHVATFTLTKGGVSGPARIRALCSCGDESGDVSSHRAGGSCGGLPQQSSVCAERDGRSSDDSLASAEHGMWWTSARCPVRVTCSETVAGVPLSSAGAGGRDNQESSDALWIPSTTEFPFTYQVHVPVHSVLQQTSIDSHDTAGDGGQSRGDGDALADENELPDAVACIDFLRLWIRCDQGLIAMRVYQLHGELSSTPTLPSGLQDMLATTLARHREVATENQNGILTFLELLVERAVALPVPAWRDVFLGHTLGTAVSLLWRVSVLEPLKELHERTGRGSVADAYVRDTVGQGPVGKRARVMKVLTSLADRVTQTSGARTTGSSRGLILSTLVSLQRRTAMLNGALRNMQNDLWVCELPEGGEWVQFSGRMRSEMRQFARQQMQCLLQCVLGVLQHHIRRYDGPYAVHADAEGHDNDRFDAAPALSHPTASLWGFLETMSSECRHIRRYLPTDDPFGKELATAVLEGVDKLLMRAFVAPKYEHDAQFWEDVSCSLRVLNLLSAYVTKSKSVGGNNGNGVIGGDDGGELHPALLLRTQYSSILTFTKQFAQFLALCVESQVDSNKDEIEHDTADDGAQEPSERKQMLGGAEVRRQPEEGSHEEDKSTTISERMISGLHTVSKGVSGLFGAKLW